MEFDRWQQWGALLDDADFARAFAALGVVAGSAAKQEAIKGFPGVLLQDPKWASPDILLTTARLALHDALAAPLPRGTGIRWRFPRADDAIDADGRFSAAQYRSGDLGTGLERGPRAGEGTAAAAPDRRPRGRAGRPLVSMARAGLADAGGAASSIHGSGTTVDPWRVPLIGPLALEVAGEGTVLSIGIAAATSVDSLGQRCTVIESRLAATIARIDLSAKTANLMPGVEGVISARERGVSPPRVTLALGDGAALTASGVGLRLGWKPGSGLAANIAAPNLKLSTDTVTLPVALPVIAADGSVSLPPAGWDGGRVERGQGAVDPNAQKAFPRYLAEETRQLRIWDRSQGCQDPQAASIRPACKLFNHLRDEYERALADRTRDNGRFPDAYKGAANNHEYR